MDTHRACAVCGAGLIKRNNESRSSWDKRRFCGVVCQRAGRPRSDCGAVSVADGIATIQLANGGTSIIDADDLPLVSCRRWRRMRDDYVAHAFHAPQIGARIVLLHRVILGVAHGILVDHLNGIRSDNRRCNLRPATHQQNAQHVVFSSRRKRGHLKGVSVSQTGRWRAACAGRYLGSFTSEEAAGRAYDAAASSQFGEFADLNFEEKS